MLFRSLRIEMIEFQEFLANKNFQNMLSSSNLDQLLYKDVSIVGGIYGLMNEILLNTYYISCNTSSQELKYLKSKYNQYDSSISSFTESISNNFETNFKEVITLSEILFSFYFIISFTLFMVIFSQLINKRIVQIQNIIKLRELIPY